MRISNAFKIMLVISLLGGLALYAAEPDISFDKQTVDFGTVQGGKVLEHVFKFKNTGTADLVIKKITAPCGCTAVQSVRAPIRPGEVGEIKTKLNTSGYRNAMLKYVYVDTNVPHMPRITLKMKADIIYDLDVAPGQYITFFNMKQGETAQREITIKNNTATKMDISNPEFTRNQGSAFKANLVEIEKGKKYKLKVAFTAGNKSGRYKGSVKMTTNIKSKPVIEVPLSAIVMENVYLQPNALIIQRNTKAFQRFKNIRIINTDDEEMKIEKVEIDEKLFDYKVEPIEKTNNYRLTVILKNDVPTTTLRGKIVIKTNSKTNSELDLRYYVGKQNIK